MPLSDNIRRVVTVVDDDGKAVGLFDGDNPHKMVRPNRNSVSRILWMTDRAPAAMSGTADLAARSLAALPLFSSRRGSRDPCSLGGRAAAKVNRSLLPLPHHPCQ